jgi:hypothetical protein
MANYVLVYKGGRPTGGDAQAAMAAWGQWFGALGAAVVDHGNPFGPSNTVGGDGAVSGGAASNLTGYSVLKADTLADATAMARNCPVVANGGTVEVYETVKM